jgi:hypothetical protein
LVEQWKRQVERKGGGVLRTDRSAGIARAEPGRTSVSPLKALALALSLLALLLVTFLLARNQSPTTTTTPPANTNPAPTLTNEEAIAEFNRLDALRIRALEDRDKSLVALAFTPTSPAGNRVRSTIDQLLGDRVRVKEKWSVKSLEVTYMSRTEIDVRIVGVQDSNFFSESGKNVTERGSAEEQTVACSMRSFEGRWLIHECTVTKANPK